jgi:hypothetical protein
MIYDYLSVHQHILDPIGREGWLKIGCTILNFVIIEHNHIRPESGRDRATALHSRCRPRRHFSNGFLQGQHLSLADIAGNHAREIAVRAGMRETGGVAASRLHGGAGVTSDAGPGKICKTPINNRRQDAIPDAIPPYMFVADG